MTKNYTVHACFMRFVLFFGSRMHELGMLNTTVQSVLEYKVGKYVFECQNTPSTHTLLNMESYDYKLYCTCLFHAICLFFGSRMHELGMLNTTVQSVLEYKVGKYVFGCQNTPSTHTLLNMESYDYKLYCTCLFHAICLVFWF
jgi:hypothetical protein